MSISRRASHRIAVQANSIDDDAASEAYVPTDDSPIVRRHTDKAFGAGSEMQGKGGGLAAGRMARNRESARRSRAGFAERLAGLVTEFKECQVTLRQLRSSSHQLIGAEATAAKERAAADSARQSFVEDIPPTRASGSRTAITDEELERQAALGDIKAERMLSNRNSARESRRRKWNEWNETRLSYEIAKAACRALAPIVAGAHFPHRASTPPTPERSAGSSAASVVSSASSDASVATATPGAAPEGDEDVFSIRAEFAQAFGAVSAAASSRRLFPCTSSASSPSYPSSSHQARTRGPSPLTALPAFSSELALSQSAELGIPVDSAEVDGAASPLAMAA